MEARLASKFRSSRCAPTRIEKTPSEECEAVVLQNLAAYIVYDYAKVQRETNFLFARLKVDNILPTPPSTPSSAGAS